MPHGRALSPMPPPPGREVSPMPHGRALSPMPPPPGRAVSPMPHGRALSPMPPPPGRAVSPAPYGHAGSSTLPRSRSPMPGHSSNFPANSPTYVTPLEVVSVTKTETVVVPADSDFGIGRSGPGWDPGYGGGNSSSGPSLHPGFSNGNGLQEQHMNARCAFPLH